MKPIFIEYGLSSFQDFHDGSWYEAIFDLADGLPIESAVEDFSFHWWGASRSFVLPWLLVDGVFKSSNGGGGTVNSEQELWNTFLQTNSFRGALWKLAEGAYGSIYYAYENLVVNIINEIQNKPCRVTDRTFNVVISNILGNSSAGKVWNNSSIAIAKEVRNCLVHRGGKASPALLKMRPLPKIEGDDVMISASDVRGLHELLKPKVLLLIEAYKKQSS